MKNKNIYLIALLTAVVLLLPYLFKGGFVLLGSEGYYHASYGDGAWAFVLHALSLFGLSSFSLSLVLPVILGISASVLFYLILKMLKLGEELSLVSSLILIMSPVFINLFVLSSQYTAPVFLSILAFYLYLKKKFVLVGAIFLLIPFFGIFSSLVSLFLLSVYVLMRDKKNFKLFFLFLLISISVLAYRYYEIFFSYGLPDGLYFKQFAGDILISDFGASFGLSVFGIILAFLGVFSNWKKGYRFMLMFFVSFLMFLAGFLFSPLVVYLNFILVVFAGFGLLTMLDRKWESNVIRNFSVLILVAGLIFSGLSYITVLSRMGPSNDVLHSLEYLGGNANANDVILSHYSNGFWISGISGKKVVIDGDFFYKNNLDEVNNEVVEIFNSRDFKRSRELFDKHSVDYVWISKNMKEGLVWDNEEQGLLFLLEFSGDFKRVYRNDEVEIWKVI